MRSLVYRLAPSGIVAAALAWCCWPYLEPDPQPLAPEGPAKLPVIELHPLLPAQESGCQRDPFRPLVAPVSPVETAFAATGDTVADEPPAEVPPPVDPAKVIRRLKLDATLIHGGRRRAIIDGEAFEEGDRLPGSPAESQPFVIGRIAAHQVTISYQGKQYNLGYRGPSPKSRPLAAKQTSPPAPTADANPQS
jgi:hypothetical protein